MSLKVNIRKKLKNFDLNISFDTEDGDISGILGSSGCGKSMTLKCIAGIEKPDSGSIILNNRVLFDSQKGINIKTQERNIGYLFQSYALFPNMTVEENIKMGATRCNNADEIKYYMELFNISDIKDSYPKKLSGGQQQRVALARMLISKPELLMLDEPFSALDSYLKEKLQIELLSIINTLKKDVLLVTHNRDEVYRFCDKVNILEEGKIVALGATKEVFKNPNTVAAARLTGCKNILKASRLDEHHIFLEDFGTEIYSSIEVPEDIRFLGVRAHDLKGVEIINASNDKNDLNNNKNIILCENPRVLNDPFELTVVFDNKLWWKVGKEEFKSIYKETIPKILYIPYEGGLFLK